MLKSEWSHMKKWITRRGDGFLALAMRCFVPARKRNLKLSVYVCNVTGVLHVISFLKIMVVCLPSPFC